MFSKQIPTIKNKITIPITMSFRFKPYHNIDTMFKNSYIKKYGDIPSNRHKRNNYKTKIHLRHNLLSPKESHRKKNPKEIQLAANNKDSL